MTDLITELHATARRLAADGHTDAPAALARAVEEIKGLRSETERFSNYSVILGYVSALLENEQLVDGMTIPQGVERVICERDQLKAANADMRGEINRLKQVFDGATLVDDEYGNRLVASDIYFEIAEMLCPQGGSVYESVQHMLEENGVLRKEVEQLRQQIDTECTVADSYRQERDQLTEEVSL
jgi:hypothetical protein